MIPLKRSAGILLPVFSLPSPWGIGTLGEAARDFIRFLEAAGQSYWQVLPLGETSFGDSPYQPFSSYAGNPYLIDLDLLRADGLLTSEDYQSLPWGEDPRQVFDRRAAQETPNASRFITADRTGVLRGITNNNAPASDIAMLELYAKAGDTVRRFEDGKDRIGQVVVTGATLDDCFRRLDEIQSRIVLDYAD